jgi:aminoglycoside 3-N-acetyltransferase
MTFASKAAELLAELGTGPVFVHSDPFRTARVVKPSRNRNEFLDVHIAVLKEVAGDRGLWIPAFNYDFPRTHVFDVAADEAQTGPIPEHFRTTAAEWRTPAPIFSVTGIGRMPLVPWGQNTDAFGEESIFARLVESDGVILYYGDTFGYNTIVHYAERRSGGPAYRYDKLFGGQVVTSADGLSVLGSLRYHVRPMGTDLDYDWPRLLDSAIEAGVCRRVEASPEVLASSARALCDFWIAALERDPLALLDQKTRTWVEPKLEKLGRRFVIADFESL